MPPEPLPWDRKELFRDRKHNHSERPPDVLGPVRWRDSSSLNGSRNCNSGGDFPRWGSINPDFRRPPGHSKQGGWHLYPEDSAHGYSTGRCGDRYSEDDGFKLSGFRGDGRYSRSYRESRGSFSQRDWRSHSWDNNHHHNTPATASTRPHDMNDQRVADENQTRPSVPHPSPVSALSQPSSRDQPDKPKELPDKLTDLNVVAASLKVDRANSPGSIDWKPLKWSRSGSLTSRGSGFSHSSGSKSNGGEASEPKNELPRKGAAPCDSPSTDTAPCLAYGSPTEETNSRKKARLGWGEGLAKYEKKKVEPEDNLHKSGNVSCHGNMESGRSHSHSSSFAEKSPKVAGMSDCASPATPSSVACSSSPGLEEKSFRKVMDLDVEANNLSVSSAPTCHNHFEGLPLNLKIVDGDLVSSLSSLLNQLIQSDDHNSMDSGSIKSTALSKLLLWREDVSKALEVTEAEIDMLETELKSLKPKSVGLGLCPASSSSLSMDCREKLHKDTSTITRPPPLEVISCGDLGEKVIPCTNTLSEAHIEVKGEDIESPGTATSEFVEALPAENLAPLLGDIHMAATNVVESSDSDLHGSIPVPVLENTALSVDERSPWVNKSSGEDGVRNLCCRILAANNEIATKASEVFLKLLPSCDYRTDAIRAPGEDHTLLLKKKFMTRKRFLKFKEKVLSLKYRAFQYLWNEDLRLLSLKKSRTRPQKKFDLSSRVLCNGHQKHRSSIRSCFSSPAGSLSMVPTEEIINYTSNLLSDPGVVSHYRDTLKMPSLILDEKERKTSRFISSNGLVEDPSAVEKERSLINPWSAEERQIFIEKLATFGKDFRKIAGFFNHKTTADCVEFYYKNHKSDSFQKAKKKPDLKREGKLHSANAYMVTSGKRWNNREVNAASLHMLGAASAIAAHVDEGVDSKKLLLRPLSDRKSRGMGPTLDRSSRFDVEDERETAAADVLAGICGSLSSEALSSCITSSVDPSEGCQEWKCQRVSSSIRWPLTPEVTQSVDDDTCSDESGGDMDPVDWTDEEKSLFVVCYSSCGKDFAVISHRIRTKTIDECKLFYGKAWRTLGLDTEHPSCGSGRTAASDDPNGGGSDTEDACVMETGSVVCSDKSGSRIDEDSPMSLSNTNYADSKVDGRIDLHSEMNMLSDNCDPGQVDDKDIEVKSDVYSPLNSQVDDASEPILDGDGVVADSEEEKSIRIVAEEREGSHDSLECREAFATTRDNSAVETRNDAVAEARFHDMGSVVESKERAEVANGKQDSVTAGNNLDMSLAKIDVKECSGHLKSSDGMQQRNLEHRFVQANDACSQSQVFRSDPTNCSVQNEASHKLQVSPASVTSRTEKHSMPTQNFYLRRCNRGASQNMVVSQKLDTGNCASENPCRTGDVKLFGQILTKPVIGENPSSNQGTKNNCTLSPGAGGKLGMKLSADHDIEEKAAVSKVDPDKFPVRSYGFWDGNQIRTGYSTLPDPPPIVAKYPAAFGNFTTPSKLDDQQALQACSKIDCNSLSVHCSSGTCSDYQAVRTQDAVQPFTLDVKQRSEMFPGSQRNGYQTGSSVQPQGKGSIKLNVVQGGEIVLGGSCAGVSDPVAALKLHYARAQQLGGGSAKRNEESWRGPGDVGM